MEFLELTDVTSDSIAESFADLLDELSTPAYPLNAGVETLVEPFLKVLLISVVISFAISLDFLVLYLEGPKSS
uniref:Uncharacterized protein n=1 Tax=Rhizophora mucronata TaxID=61149 RepID=A0A2P2QVE0_RHIMU